MNVFVRTPVNCRVGAPSVNAEKRGFLGTGATLDAVQTVQGDAIDGNDLWYRDAAGLYYWSGAFDAALPASTAALEQRQFYIIGHNPNTVPRATKCLEIGANALEPDLCFDDTKPERYFISGMLPVELPADVNPLTKEYCLSTYLAGLKDLLSRPGNTCNLALIAFDVKTPAFDINEFLAKVRDEFLVHDACRGIAILVTVSGVDDKVPRQFIASCDETMPGTGVGVDESADPEALEKFFIDAGKSAFAYAYGITVGLRPEQYYCITRARGLQAKGGTASFKFIYTWSLTNGTVNHERFIRNYLDLHVDGMIVDNECIPEVLATLNTEPYKSTYAIARRGQDPFSAWPISAYVLTVHTRVHNPVTQAVIRFTLTGENGARLHSDVDTNHLHMMDNDTYNSVTIEGANIGVVKSLTMEFMTDSYAWMPESIVLESPLHDTVTFMFDDDDEVSMGNPLTKYSPALASLG